MTTRAQRILAEIPEDIDWGRIGASAALSSVALTGLHYVGKAVQRKRSTNAGYLPYFRNRDIMVHPKTRQIDHVTGW